MRPVDGRARRARDIACQPANHVGGNAGEAGDVVRIERLEQREQCVEPGHETGGRPHRPETLIEDDADDGRQKGGIGAGPDGDVLVSRLGGAGHPRVDHDHGATPGLDGLDPAREIGCGAEAAVRCVRVGADDHEEIGAVEVGYRHAGAPVEPIAGDLTRNLVDGARRVAALGPDGSYELSIVDRAGQHVGHGIPEVDGHGLFTVIVAHGGQFLVDDAKRLLPTDLLEHR